MFKQTIFILTFLFSLYALAQTTAKPNEVECWIDKASFERKPENPDGGLYRIHYTTKDYYTWHLYYSGDVNVEYNDISSDSNLIELQDPEGSSFIFFSAASAAVYDITRKILFDYRNGGERIYNFCRESSVLRIKEENIPFEAWM